MIGLGQLLHLQTDYNINLIAKCLFIPVIELFNDRLKMLMEER
jgi:hypothetical protein